MYVDHYEANACDKNPDTPTGKRYAHLSAIRTAAWGYMRIQI
jgi:hypothetical protein